MSDYSVTQIMQSLRLSHQRLLRLASLRPATTALVTETCSPNFMALGGLRFRHSKRVNAKIQRKGDDGIPYFGFKFYPRYLSQIERILLSCFVESFHFEFNFLKVSRSQRSTLRAYKIIYGQKNSLYVRMSVVGEGSH